MLEEKFIESLYAKIDKNNLSKNSEILFTILQLKSKSNSLFKIEQSLYLDVKDFSFSYINSFERKDFGYDHLNIEKIYQAISFLPDINEQNALAKYVNHLLYHKGFEQETDDFKKYSNKIKTDYLKRPSGLKSKLKLLSHLCSYNLQTLFFLLLLGFVISFIIFLPAPFESMQFFELNYYDYANQFYLNHFLNLVSSIFELESIKIIEPLNGYGVIWLSFLKLFYVLLVINYLYKQILNIIYGN